MLLTLAFAGAAVAQDPKPASTPVTGASPPIIKPPVENRGEILKMLGLTREQMQTIRRINAGRKPLMDAAQTRSKEANKALDEAIYADQLNETDFQTRLQASQRAQAEIMRIRFATEFAVRRLLTPEQLVRFRELRQRFEKARENVVNPVSNDRPAAMNNQARGPGTGRSARQLIRQNLKRATP